MYLSASCRTRVPHLLSPLTTPLASVDSPFQNLTPLKRHNRRHYEFLNNFIIVEELRATFRSSSNSVTKRIDISTNCARPDTLRLRVAKCRPRTGAPRSRRARPARRCYRGPIGPHVVRPRALASPSSKEVFWASKNTRYARSLAMGPSQRCSPSWAQLPERALHASRERGKCSAIC